MAPLVVLFCAGGACMCAAALTGWIRRLASAESRWFRSGLHVWLAAGGGAGAGMLARDWGELVAFALLALACALLVVIDLATYRLPNQIVGPLYLVILLTFTVSAAWSRDWTRLSRAGAAAAIIFTIYFALAWMRPSGLGLGDVKLAGVLGAFLGWLGWANVVVGVTAGFLLAGLVATAMLITRRGSRSSVFPFAPWMVLGAVIGASFAIS